MNYLRRLQAERPVIFWVLVALGLLLDLRPARSREGPALVRAVRRPRPSWYRASNVASARGLGIDALVSHRRTVG